MLENQSRQQENVNVKRLINMTSEKQRDNENGDKTFKLPSLLPSHHDAKRTTSSKGTKNNNSATIMFTRLDAESNSKRLELAYNKGILTDLEYQVLILFFFSFQIPVYKNNAKNEKKSTKSASNLMKDYRSLPLLRFSELIKKYISLKTIKTMEGKLFTFFSNNYNINTE